MGSLVHAQQLLQNRTKVALESFVDILYGENSYTAAVLLEDFFRGAVCGFNFTPEQLVSGLWYMDSCALTMIRESL